MSLGKLGKSWMIDSETCAFDAVGGKFVRDVRSGEMIIIDKNELKSISYAVLYLKEFVLLNTYIFQDQIVM